MTIGNEHPRPDAESWRDHAACKNEPKATFYPEQGEHFTVFPQALAICARCPGWVRSACLEAGLYERYGVWGGMSGLDRRMERKRRAIEAGTYVEQPKRDGLKPCGTVAAFQRHVRNSETPCDLCLRARNEEKRLGRLKKRENAAQEEATA